MGGKMPPPVDVLTFPEDCPLCHVCQQPIGPLHKTRVNDAGYKVHESCRPSGVMIPVTGLTTQQLARRVVETGRGPDLVKALCEELGFTLRVAEGQELLLEHEHLWRTKLGEPDIRRCVFCGAEEALPNV